MDRSKQSQRAPAHAQHVIQAGKAARRRVAQAVEVRRPQPEPAKPVNEKELSTFEVEMLRAWSAP